VIVENGIHYIREPNGSLIARVSSSNTSYYHFDQLGSTRLLTDADGDVTDEYAYDAYGALLSHNRRAGSVGQPYQYVGRLGYYTCWQEPEFELLQLGIRYYDPSTGRFTQEDLSGDGLNWYEYVYGRPIIGTDPYGLFCTKDFVDHYYHGHGESIDLGNVGLLPRFRNSNSVRRSVENFHQMALSTAKKMAASKCRCHGGGSGAYTFSLDNNDVTDVTTEECLFAVGHSSFFRKGSCHLIVSCETRTFRLDCSMNYGIRDSFNDPLDIGIELPGGTAYKINAGWNERFETEGLW
jgi:RHS repeat-associated protein